MEGYIIVEGTAELLKSKNSLVMAASVIFPE